MKKFNTNDFITEVQLFMNDFNIGESDMEKFCNVPSGTISGIGHKSTPFEDIEKIANAMSADIDMFVQGKV